MKEEDRILLTLGWGLIMVAIIVLICRTTYKLDKLQKRLDQLAKFEPLPVATATDATVTDATVTDATATEATPAEPSDEEIVIELLDEYKTTETETATPAEPEPEEPERVYAGNYELTAYIATGNPCADGVYPQTGFTAASNDPKLWHKTIEVEGYGTYYVHDTGGMSSNVIDIFVGSYDEAVQFGRRSADVYIKN